MQRPSRCLNWAGMLCAITLSIPVFAQTEILSKLAIPTTSPPGSATGGELVDWVLSYESAGAGAILIQDNLPQGLSYVPGSLLLPPGWSSTFLNTTGYVIEAESDGASSAATAAIQEFSFPTINASFGTVGGDGTIPILVNDRVYALHHHQPADSPAIACLERATGTICAGYPYALSTTVGPASAAGLGSGNIGTVLFQDEYPIVGDRLYYGAQTSADYGIGCFDFATQENCSYVALGAVPDTLGPFPATFSMKQVGDLIFTIDINHDVACFDLSTLAACPGYPQSVGGVAEGLTPFDPGTNTQGGPTLLIEEIDGRLVYVMNHGLFAVPGSSAYGSASEISCFDTASAQRCAGWTSISATATTMTDGVTPGGGGYNSIIKRRSSSGTTLGFCAIGNTGVFGISSGVLVDCYDLNGIAIPSPAGLGAPWLASALAIIDLEIGDRVYIPLMHSFSGVSPGYTGATQCWDWSIDGPCPGFGVDGYRPWTDINGAETSDYGYVTDGTCLYGLGDSGYVWSFDPETGAAPCAGVLLVEMDVDSERFYCDSLVHTPNWSSFNLSDIDLVGGNEFSAIQLEIFDNLGTSLFGPSNLLNGSGQVDLSAIGALAGQEQLRFVVTGAPVGTAPWDDNVAPKTEVQFGGDPAQICFATTVDDACALDGRQLTNTAVTFPGGSIASDQLNITADASCTGPPVHNGSTETNPVPSLPLRNFLALIALLALMGVSRLGTFSITNRED
jgi:hypothetical protein